MSWISFAKYRARVPSLSCANLIPRDSKTRLDILEPYNIDELKITMRWEVNQTIQQNIWENMLASPT